MNKQYIKLPKISNQTIRQKYYTSESVRHPAKANIPMMIWILRKFCKDGDIILDPMAGIFTTGIEGMRLFPNSLFIGVELEDKFVKMTQANIKKTEEIAKIGKAICVQGDARELEKVLKEKVDKIISSPPYSESIRTKTDADKRLNRLEKAGYLKKKDWQRPGNIKTLGRNAMFSENLYSKNEDNIGNLKHGKIDKVISSPPFGQAQSGGGIAKKGYNGPKHTPTDLIGKRSYMPENTGVNKNNIDKLPYVDKVISSPPYAHESTASNSTKLEKQGKFRMGHSDEVSYTDENYRTWNKHQGENIGKRKLFIKIPCSPKEAQFHDKRKERKGTVWEYTKEVKATPEVIDKIQNFKNENKGKSETYLEAMFLVYQQCLKILKPGGLMILILKDFIRNKRRVHLTDDTIKLCEMAGFKYIHTYYRKIEHPSFWRILYQQKHPEVEKIDSEDIVVFEKD